MEKGSLLILLALFLALSNGIKMPSDESIQRAKEILDKNPVIDG